MATARDLARAYDRCHARRWRDDQGPAPFVAWLEGYWCALGPPQPDGLPDAFSFLGVRWYEQGDRVLGYEARRPAGCYRVPADAEPPADTPTGRAA